MLYEISKLYEFEAAHQLEVSCASAECERVHGHSYKVRVGIQTEALNDEEMVMNFNELDNIIKPVIDKMDHRMLVPVFNKRVDGYNKVPGLETHTLEGALHNTTAERLAEFFVRLVYRALIPVGYPLKKIWAEVNETRKCQARAEMEF